MRTHEAPREGAGDATQGSSANGHHYDLDLIKGDTERLLAAYL